MPTTILDGEAYEQARHRRFTEEAKVIEKIQQDEIIRVAREAGFGWCEGLGGMPKELERFAALVAAYERERCAILCDEIATVTHENRDGLALMITAVEACAEAIRGLK